MCVSISTRTVENKHLYDIFSRKNKNRHHFDKLDAEGTEYTFIHYRYIPL